MLLEAILRNSSPVSLRIAVLALILVVSILQALNPSWLTTNRVLASLPIQRFKWKSETFLSSALNRTASLISTSLAFSILIFAHFIRPEFFGESSEILSFVQLFVLVLALFVLKLLGMKLFFSLHEQTDAGTMVIDYQYAFNQLLTLGLVVIVCFDVFVLRLSSPIYITVSVIVALVFLLRLLGNILMLLNNFNYPIISLFIYLCAFEIIPMLAVAKVLFENS